MIILLIVLIIVVYVRKRNNYAENPIDSSEILLSLFLSLTPKNNSLHYFARCPYHLAVIVFDLIPNNVLVILFSFIVSKNVKHPIIVVTLMMINFIPQNNSMSFR